jgi:hypothetical protein
VQNLVVVAGNLLIPAVSKLNAGRSLKHHLRIPLLSTCRSQGNPVLSLFFIVVYFIANPLLLRRKKPAVKELPSKRTKPSPAAIP